MILVAVFTGIQGVSSVSTKCSHRLECSLLTRNINSVVPIRSAEIAVALDVKYSIRQGVKANEM